MEEVILEGGREEKGGKGRGRKGKGGREKWMKGKRR